MSEESDKTPHPFDVYGHDWDGINPPPPNTSEYNLNDLYKKPDPNPDNRSAWIISNNNVFYETNLPVKTEPSLLEIRLRIDYMKRVCQRIFEKYFTRIKDID